MDLNYLVKTLLPQREKEIKQEKNLATRQPIYVVFNLLERYVSGHNEFSSSTNHKGKDWECGYIDMHEDAEDRVFKKTDKKMVSPEPISRFFIDEFAGFFLTSKAAHDYLKYQAHNLTKPYVYVFNSGYANKEMDQLLNNE